MAAVTIRQSPASLRWAVWLLTVEAVMVGVVTVGLIYEVIAGEPRSLADALAVAGFVALVAACLAGLALALARRKPRARAPAIVLQLLLVMFGYVLSVTGLAVVGLPLGLLGLVTGTLLLAPSTGQGLSGPPAGGDSAHD